MPASSQVRSLRLGSPPAKRWYTSFPTLTPAAIPIAPSSAGPRWTPVSLSPLNAALSTNAATKKCFTLSAANQRSPPGEPCSARTSINPRIESSSRRLVARPADRRAHGALPPAHGILGSRPRQAWSEGGEPPRRHELVGAPPYSGRQSGEPCRAKRRGLDHVRPLHRDAEHVGLKLHEPVVHGRAAIHAEAREVGAAGATHLA